MLLKLIGIFCVKATKNFVAFLEYINFTLQCKMLQIPAPNFVPGLLESNLLVENFYSQGNMVFISMYGTSIYWHITYVSAQHSEIKRIVD